MKKISILLITLLLFTSTSACRKKVEVVPNSDTAEAPTTEATHIPTSEPQETTNLQETSKLQGVSETNPTKTSEGISVNTELISHVGQPFSFFKEKYGLQLSDLEMFSEGPPVGKYTMNNSIYVFNNPLGYDALSDETPCTGIDTPYTVLLQGINAGGITEKKLKEIFDDVYNEYGFLNIDFSDKIKIKFRIKGDGTLDETAYISMTFY